MRESMTVETLSGSYRNPEIRVVDTRPSAAYNGWRLRDEARGGHIPGAVAFPLAWAEVADRADLAARLADKGLAAGDPIVVYGHDTEEGTVLADHLTELGYPNVAVLEGGQRAWAARQDLELVRLPGFRQLVYPEWLHRLLAGEEVEEAPRGEYAVFHVNPGEPQDYEEGHIEGAFYLDTNALESSQDWNRRSPAELEAALLELGISKDTTVIVYGRDSASDPREQKGRRAGQIAAARTVAILLYAGVEDVRLLDGGLNRWLDTGYGVETEVRTPSPKEDFGTAIPARRELFIDYEEAVELLSDPEGELVSVRSQAEHQGKTSGYNYISHVGDIPGAVWAPCGTDAHNMQNYRNVDNTMRDFNEVAANWEEVGIIPDKKVAFYCGTGARASEALFDAYLMGWPNVAVYDGGWLEWTRRSGDDV